MKSSNKIIPKIGTRVKIIGNIDGNGSLLGMMATIKKADKYMDGYDIALAFDENIQGHECGGVCKNGYGRYAGTDDWNDGHFEINNDWKQIIEANENV
jgi:hypothetical protein